MNLIHRTGTSMGMACGSLADGGGSQEPTALVDHALVDDLVGSDQNGLWDREPKSLGGFEIDHQLELRGLLDGKLAGLGALEDLVDEHGDALLGVPRVLLVGHQATLL